MLCVGLDTASIVVEIPTTRLIVESLCRKQIGVRPHRITILHTALVGLISTGCGSDSGTQSVDRLVAGINFTQLSASPSSSEIAEVQASWQQRDVAAHDVREEAVGEISATESGVVVKVLSHLVDGDRHVGAAVVPKGVTQPLPVLVYAHFGEGGVSVVSTLFLIPLVIGALAHEYVLAIPSFRSQALMFGGVSYRSQGEPSPWVGEVDDGLAFLNVVLETTPEADPERIAVFGMSGGGSNALLMAIRDARIGRVIDFFAPTDFFAPFVMEILEDALLGESGRDLPGTGFLEQELVPMMQSGELSPAGMRHELLQRSPLYFVDRLPLVQIHHGTADDVVPLSQSRRLNATMAAAGNASEFFEYQGGGHFPFELAGSQTRAITFLNEFVGGRLVALPQQDNRSRW